VAIIAKTPQTTNVIPPPSPNPSNEFIINGLIFTNCATEEIVNAKIIATPNAIITIEVIITNHFAHLSLQQHII